MLGLRCYPDLASVPGTIDLVDVFRQSDAVFPIAERHNGWRQGLWLQLGVFHPAALRLAEEAGLHCVADLCTKIEHARLNL